MSEEMQNKGNPKPPREKVSDENARSNRDSGREGYRNNRRSGSGPSDRTDRSAAEGRQAGGQERNNSKTAANPGERDFPRRDRGYDNRRRGPRPVSAPAQEGNAQANRALSANKHTTREIRPDDSPANQAAANRDNREKVGNPNYDKRRNRGEYRPEKRPQSEPKTWGRNIRSEETSEDIRKDNERIEKEIWLEIAGIHTMKLD